MSKVRVGIIGGGRIGRLHAENLVRFMPEAEVTCLSDVYIENAEPWAKELGIAKLSKNVQDVFGNPDIDAVLICSPTNTHAEYAIAAARAGKHVFCEKPIDFSIPRIQEVLQAVKQAGIVFQVGFNRRFDTHFHALRERVQAGDIGDVHIVKITSRDPSPPPLSYVQSSGGLFLDMAIHDFDMARYLCGSEVAEVYARGAALINPEVAEVGDIDTAVTVLQMENGAMVVIDNSRQAVYGYDQRLEVFGSAGQLTADNVSPTNLVYSGANGVSRDKPMYFFLERYNDSFITEMRSFLKSVREGSQPEVTAFDGYAAVLIGVAAKASLETGKPVSVSSVESHANGRDVE